MRKMKKLLAVVMALCCLLSMNMNLFAESAQTVGVEIYANDGTFITDNGNDTTMGYYYDLPVGSTLSAEGITLTEPVFWDENRALEGWIVGTYVEKTGEDGSTWTEFEQLSGTGLLTMTQVLNYTIPDEDISFQAKWAGDDADYYSHVNIDGYRAEFKFQQYYWENDTMLTEEISTTGWESRLKENNVSIKDQVADNCILLTEPEREDAAFEGWLKFKVEEVTADDGSSYSKRTLVDNTVYTTEQMLGHMVPEYDVAYVAKWSDIPIDQYFYEAPEYHVCFDANGGTFEVNLRGNVSTGINQYDGNFKEGKSLESWDFSITDPVFWVNDRNFAGWLVGQTQEVTDDEGNKNTEWVQLPDTGILTTAQTLAYVMPDHELIFRAQWDGDDADYYSQIYVHGYGAGVPFEYCNWVDGQETWVEDTNDVHGQWLKDEKSGQSFKTQVGSYMKLKSDPVRSDAVFEGWAEFKVYETAEGDRFELVSDTLYTSEQMMERLIPEYDVAYVAKWSDIELEDYFQDFQEASQVEIAVSANGGRLKLDALDNDGNLVEFVEKSWQYGMGQGMSISDMFAEGITTPYKSVEKEGFVQAGWTFYECESISWHDVPVGTETTIGDPDIEIFYFDSYLDENDDEWDHYIVLEYPRIVDAHMTTEELYNFEGDKCYFALANWKENAVAEEQFGEKPVYRISGKDRYQTSYATADVLKAQMGIEKFDSVIVAAGKNFPDALAGSYLAAKKNAPILMANPKDATALQAYIEQNLGKGGTIYVLGGEGAVPESTFANLTGYQICRLSGKTRYETNMQILAEAEVETVEEILICTGKGFADSLSASATGKPILLVASELKPEQIEFLEEHAGSRFYIIGGEGAVNAEIEEELKAYGTVERMAGKTRYETSVLVAEKFFDSAETAVVAYAKNFPDGLCGGPLAMTKNAPLILTAAGKEDLAVDYMQSEQIGIGAVLGGSGLVTDEAVENIFGVSEIELW